MATSLATPVWAGSDPTAPAYFIRGDANGDGHLDISDVIYTLLFLFRGDRLREPPSCLDALDANDDGRVNISDPTYLLNTLFRGGDPPPYPGPPIPGIDPTPDNLACGRSIPGRFVVGVTQGPPGRLSGVTVGIGSIETRSEADGRFGFQDPPLGDQTLAIDPTRVDATLSPQEIPIQVKEGVQDVGVLFLYRQPVEPSE